MKPNAPVQAKSQVIPRIDPDEDFSDVDGDPRTEFALDESSMDPTRHYHWAHNSRDDISSYVGGVLGYKVENLADGGVRPKMGYGIKLGEAITKRDHVLISCDVEKWDKLQRYRKKQTLAHNQQMFKKSQRAVTAGMRE